MGYFGERMRHRGAQGVRGGGAEGGVSDSSPDELLGVSGLWCHVEGSSGPKKQRGYAVVDCLVKQGKEGLSIVPAMNGK